MIFIGYQDPLSSFVFCLDLPKQDGRSMLKINLSEYAHFETEEIFFLEIIKPSGV